MSVSLPRDGDIEMLIPSVYGEEAADRKREARRPRWDGEAFWEHAQATSLGPVLDVIRQLHAWAVAHHASFFWGEGKRHPSMAAWIRIDEQDAPVWSCYLDDDDRSVLGLNFEWLLSRAGEESLRQLAAELAAIPGIVPLLQGLEQAGYRKRPGAPIATVLTNADSLATLLRAYDTLIVTQP